MFKKPNESATCSKSAQKNDLFRKFKDYFIGATEKEFRQYDLYGKEGYVSILPDLENRIYDILSCNIDEILPIVGATGVGKTYLLLYCLKTFYNTEIIPTNSPILFPTGDSYDLIYYSDFTITEQSVLKNPDRLCLSKIKAMHEYIMTQDFFDIEDEFDVNSYIKENNLEVKYYEEKNKLYEKELLHLTLLLSSPNIPIKNVIFIFDDLESLTEAQQFSLMDNFLTLFERIKSKSKNKFFAKFIFSLRNNTYYNIYKKDFYNTHRASKAAYVSSVPSLSQIFNTRFDIILKSEKVKKAKNETSWRKAKEILIDIADRVDSSYTNLLLKINNNNISKALDDFLDIISNRRWTQKNMNPTASFVIESENYYINDINILRILTMGERDIYYQTTTMPIRCILQNPGASNQADLISFMVLRAFRFRNYSNMDDNSISSRLISLETMITQICRFIIPFENKDMGENSNYSRIKSEVKAAIKSNFRYYEENRFIHKNVNPEISSGNSEYYMLPRGEEIFDLFFSRSILFTIFRDEFLLDAKVFDVRTSNMLNFEKLLIETIKYERKLIDLETSLFKRIDENRMWHNYISFLGQWSISESFLNGIENSVRKYYKRDTPPPANLIDQINLLKAEVTNLTETFKKTDEENSWF